MAFADFSALNGSDEVDEVDQVDSECGHRALETYISPKKHVPKSFLHFFCVFFDFFKRAPLGQGNRSFEACFADLRKTCNLDVGPNPQWSYMESGTQWIFISCAKCSTKWTHQINERSEKSASEGCAWPGPMCELNSTS